MGEVIPAGLRTSKRPWARGSALDATLIGAVRFKRIPHRAAQRLGPARPGECNALDAWSLSLSRSPIAPSSPKGTVPRPSSLKSFFTPSLHKKGSSGSVTPLAPYRNRRLRAKLPPRIGTADGLVHDLNNLLAIIKVNLQLLDREIADDGQRSLVRDALDASDLCNELTKGLSAERRETIECLPALDLNQEVAAVGNLIRRTLGPNVQVAQDLARNLGRTRVDPALLRNACLNLVANARDAMPTGGRLVITTANVAVDAATAAKQFDAKPGVYVVLSLRDTSPGISPEILGRIFEPYFTTKSKDGSMGLGLFLVREFCEQHEGFVRVESRAGEGTTVSIFLPRCDD